MKAKKNLLIFASAGVILTSPLTAMAGDKRGLNPTFKAEKQELRQDLKDKVGSLKEDLKQKIGGLKNQVAKIIGGEITAVSGTTLTVSKDGKSYTVNTDANTHFQRHFWGKSSLSEFSVGDKVNVHGKFTDDAKTIILARMVRNLSIMKRFGVFFGEVKTKNSDNFILTSKQRGDQTVFFDSNTKFIKRNQTGMTYGDLQVGQRVRVRGLWDKKLNKITEVKEVKDFLLPPQPTKTGVSVTAGPTVTVIPTATPTLTLTPTPSPTP